MMENWKLKKVFSIFFLCLLGILLYRFQATMSSMQIKNDVKKDLSHVKKDKSTSQLTESEILVILCLLLMYDTLS